MTLHALTSQAAPVVRDLQTMRSEPWIWWVGLAVFLVNAVYFVIPKRLHPWRKRSLPRLPAVVSIAVIMAALVINSEWTTLMLILTCVWAVFSPLPRNRHEPRRDEKSSR